MTTASQKAANPREIEPTSTPFVELLTEADTPTDWLIAGIISDPSQVLVHG